MSRSPHGLALVVALLTACGASRTRPDAISTAVAPPAAATAPLIEIVLCEGGEPSADGLAELRALAPEDPRQAQARKLLDNEAARFIRRLIAATWRARLGAAAALPALPIVLRKGGNHAKVGYRLEHDGPDEAQPDRPFVLLELDAESLSHTLLHEGGHVVQSIAWSGRSLEAPWSAVVHSTFAVTDPSTALAEGFAIQLETLWGHYGEEPVRRAYYHRLAPDFEGQHATAAEFFAPVRDILTFSQTFARYQAVRDGSPAFSGVVVAGDYLRSQYDPARDQATLKRPNAMIASEGVVAAVLFWIAAGEAEAARVPARPGAGLDQPALLDAELALAAALRGAMTSGAAQPFRPDLIDVVAAVRPEDRAARHRAVARLVDMSRGVTAKPELAAAWSQLYHAALSADLRTALTELGQLAEQRRAIASAGEADPTTLRAGLGPVLPVRVAATSLRLVGLGESFPLEFDLNAAGPAELAALTLANDTARRGLAAELDRAPFSSLADAERRLGRTLASLGLAAVDLPPAPKP